MCHGLFRTLEEMATFKLTRTLGVLRMTSSTDVRAAGFEAVKRLDRCSKENGRCRNSYQRFPLRFIGLSLTCDPRDVPGFASRISRGSYELVGRLESHSTSRRQERLGTPGMGRIARGSRCDQDARGACGRRDGNPPVASWDVEGPTAGQHRSRIRMVGDRGRGRSQPTASAISGGPPFRTEKSEGSRAGGFRRVVPGERCALVDADGRRCSLKGSIDVTSGKTIGANP